jgi:S1-C subfamily serine protease
VKRFAALLVSVLFALPLLIGAASAPKSVLDIREGVLRVVSTYRATADGMSLETDAAIGTAFVIAHKDGATYLVTNRHVVYDDDGDPMTAYIIPNDLDDTRLKAETLNIGSSGNLDLVLLKVSFGLSDRPRVPLRRAAAANVGDGIYALGFPAISDVLNANDKLSSGADDVTLTNGIIGKVNIDIGGYKYFQHNVTISGGNSGGPLLDGKGAAIGVNTIGTSLYGVYASIYIDYVMDYCNEHDIPYVRYGRLGLAIGLGCGAAVVVALCFLVLPRFKKRNGRAGRPSFALTGVSGQYAGAEIPLGARTIIGRDPAQCNIVFDGGTKGVSGVHCELNVVGAAVTLTDRGSSYGTFLSNGVKLTPNQPYTLISGSRFTIGSDRTEFILREVRGT